MTEAWIGEIRAFPYTYVPQGWFLCDGSKKPINDYTPLYVVIGTTYGGDNKTYFNVPDLRGRAALCFGTASTGTNYALGAVAGEETVILSKAQIPAHNHAINTLSVGYQKIPTAYVQTPDSKSFPARYVKTATSTAQDTYSAAGANLPAQSVQMDIRMLATAGSTNPTAHENRQPYLPIFYAICWNGYYPVKP
jgi:microcystin-dependent protein